VEIVKNYWVQITPEHTVNCLGKGWRTFLRARAQIIYKFRRNSFACPWEFWRAK